MDINLKQNIVFEQPTTETERAQAAESCVLGLDLKMPMAMDDMDDTVNNAYMALPERLYLLDEDGIIIYKSGPGPWGFDMDGWENAIIGKTGV